MTITEKLFYECLRVSVLSGSGGGGVVKECLSGHSCVLPGRYRVLNTLNIHQESLCRKSR